MITVQDDNPDAAGAGGDRMSASRTPERIQRSRRKGFRLPPNAIYVGGGTIWANPYGFDANRPMDRLLAALYYRRLFLDPPSLMRHERLVRLSGRGEGRVAEMKARLHELRGHDLACWCPVSAVCHADVLLELANTDVFAELADTSD